jgi:hypothetical protein
VMRGRGSGGKLEVGVWIGERYWRWRKKDLYLIQITKRNYDDLSIFIQKTSAYSSHSTTSFPLNAFQHILLYACST